MMSDTYKKFKVDVLDPISPSFCAAKWLTTDFWLHTGTTSSCHLPAPDKIDLELVKNDIRNFNNTPEKLHQKELMLSGERPDKCSNCWYIEDASSDATSHRFIYSKFYYDNLQYSQSDFNSQTKPVKIRVAFDTLCNFTCSYCDPSQSSSWAGDVKLNGVYKGIKSDPRFTYLRSGSADKVNDYDAVFEYFCEYVEFCKDTLTGIGTLGGEPLMSPYFWTFVDRLQDMNFENKITLDITTNLSNKKLLDKIVNIAVGSDIDLIFVVSIENILAKAEAVRHGLKWDDFSENLHFLLNNTNYEVRLTCTVNNLAIDGLVEFLDWYNQLFSNYPNRLKLYMYPVRHPNFQALQVLPDSLKAHYKKQIDFWINGSTIYDNNIHQVVSSVSSILANSLTEFEGVDTRVLESSARSFYKEYASRRHFNISETFSDELTEWIYNGEHNG